MSRTVYLCEKRSAAMALANALAAPRTPRQENGVFETGKGRVVHARGHLLRALKPDELDAANSSYSYDRLPILPDQLKYIPMDRDAAELLRRIKKEIQKADLVVVATDTGREGDFIGKQILDYVDYKGAFERLPLTALDGASIREQLKEMRENAPELRMRFRLGAMEGAARAYADWLLGMNATRAATVKLKTRGDGQEPFAGGGVKYPLVKMVVDRERAIEAFKPTVYYHAHVEVEAGKDPRRIIRLTAVDDKGNAIRFDTEQKAQAVAKSLHAGQLELNVDERVKSVLPPKLMNTDDLVRSAGRVFGWPGSKTNKVAQRLYQKGLISYPRGEGDKLPMQQIGRVGSIMANIGRRPEFAKSLAPWIKAAEWEIRKGLRYVSLTRAGSHHAIVPTTLQPYQLEGDERLLYKLIAENYAMNHLPDGRDVEIVVGAKVKDVRFEASTKAPVSAGWRDLAPDLLPGPAPWLDAVRGRQSVQAAVKGQETSRHETQPPKRFKRTELPAAMARLIDHVPDELKPALRNDADPDKPKGLGTADTRAPLVDEAIEQNNYLGLVGEKKNGELKPTSRGFGVIEGFEKYDPVVVDPVSRAIFESRLQKIVEARSLEEGRKAVSEVTEVVRRDVSRVIDNLRGAHPVPRRNTENALPVTKSQLELARKLVKERPGLKLPEAARQDRNAMSTFLKETLATPGRQTDAQGDATHSYKPGRPAPDAKPRHGRRQARGMER